VKGAKKLKQKFDFQHAQQQEFIIQLQQSIAQLQQVNYPTAANQCPTI